MSRELNRRTDECLKHSYYTRVRFMFLVDFTFKYVHGSPDLCSFLCIEGEEGGFGNLELKRRSRRKTGSNVATFQRRDIATSQHLVNREKSTSDPTS